MSFLPEGQCVCASDKASREALGLSLLMLRPAWVPWGLSGVSRGQACCG